VIHKAAILRLYPNRQQAASLRRWSGGLRFVWNATLAWCNEQRTLTGKWPNKSAIQTFVVSLKKQDATAWVAGIPAHALLSLAADCHRAFGNCPRRTANVETAWR
jgi:putative transposase